ncbi:helix-turn-helix domain-containing protein [Streptomyces sp. NPDC017979]|uniref:nSTAND1 domain-containing NTPase n=1 Tax=Streptomyces sp. NPDC017979 TaxID=3365024 RepID=UPI00378FBF6B
MNGDGVGRPEKVLDPAAGPVPRFADGLRALRREAGGLSYRELARRTGYSVTALSQAAAGEKLPTLPVALAYVDACGGDAQEWEDRWRSAEEEHLACGARDEGAAPPYRGLARFEPEDEALFFGRGRLTDELVELVAAHRFTVVFGPSGSGKSSLLRAGLIPRLRTSPAAPAALRIFTPGEHPMRSRGELLVPAAGPGETWLVVDQFEEAFTLCSDAGERAEFLAALLAARRDDSGLRVVLGVRADFYGHCLAHPELAAAVKEAALPVGPLTAAELREAVVKPAAAAGLVVERALTARLVEEVAGEPGSLPLLSHALLETWRRRRGRTLTLEGHRAAGGLHGAIVQTAEDLYAQLTPDQADEARRILLSLITPGDGVPDTRRPVGRPELVPHGPGSDAHTVLDRLARARLVTLDRDTVDLAHEALITAWPRLRGWIDESRERLRRHRRLAQAAHNWQARRRDGGALLRGGELDEFESTFAARRHRRELTPQESEYLRASSTARSRSRWGRRAVVATLAVLVVLAVVAVDTAWREGRTSQRQREESAARRMASLAQGVRAADPVLAMQLGLTAWRLKQTTETRSALLGAFTQPETDTYDVPDGAETVDYGNASAPLRLSSDGRTAVTTDVSGIRAWDVTTHKALGPLVPLDDRTSVAGITADGRTAALRTWGESPPKYDVQAWDLVAGKPVGAPLRTNKWGVAYAPDSRTFVETKIDSSGGSLTLRDLRTGRVVFERSTGTGPMWAMSPDSRLLALCPEWPDDRRRVERAPLQLWDVREGRKLPVTWRGACAAESPQFTGDGDTLMARSADGLRFWDPATGRERARIRHALLTEAVTSSDGRFVVAADSREILLWRLSAPGKPVFRFPLANEVPTELRVDTAAGVIRYVTKRHRMDTVVRTVSYGHAISSAWSREPSGKGVFSRDGRTLAVERRRGSTSFVEVYGVPDGRRIARTPGVRCAKGENAVLGMDCHTLLALSPDGRTLVHGRTTLHGTEEPAEFRNPTLWDVRTDAPAPPLVDPRPPHSAKLPMTGLAFTADGRSLLITRYGMDALDIWDLDRRQRARPDTQSTSHATVSGATTDHPHRLLARPDGRLVVTPRYLFDMPSGLTAARSPNLDDASAFAFSPAGDRLAAGDSAGGVTLWDGDVRKRHGALVGTQNAARRGTVEAVTALAFSPDGGTLALAGDSGTLQLWDVASGQPLGSPLPTPGDRVVAVAFTADGRTVHSVGAYSGIQAHAVDPGRLTAAVCKRAGGGLSREDWRTYLPDVPYRQVC